MDQLEIITVTDLRLRMRQIMEQVKYKGHRFQVQTFGQPTAIIMSVDEYNQLANLNPSLENSYHGDAPRNQ